MPTTALPQYDSYTMYARVYPAVLTVIPFLMMWYYVRRMPGVDALGTYLLGLVIAGVGLSVVFIYFYAQLIRWTGKLFESWFFLRRRGFPTTYFMLFKDAEYSEQSKIQYRRSIAERFDFRCPSSEDEVRDPAGSCKVLSEAGRLAQTKVGQVPKVEKLNSGYGFARNLLGGAVWGLLASILNLLLGLTVVRDSTFAVAAGVFGAIYLGLLLLSKPLLVQQAEAFARAVITEFLALPAPERRVVS